GISHEKSVSKGRLIGHHGVLHARSTDTRDTRVAAVRPPCGGTAAGPPAEVGPPAGRVPRPANDPAPSSGRPVTSPQAAPRQPRKGPAAASTSASHRSPLPVR